MNSFGTSLWSRRRWLQSHALGMAAVAVQPSSSWSRTLITPAHTRQHRITDPVACATAQAVRIDPASWQALAQRAVEAAQAVGAQYADARLTRTVRHNYGVAGNGAIGVPIFRGDEETIGIGVRALVNGYWGFSASTVLAPDEAARLGRDAVAQAKDNAKGPPWTVELGTIPVATGTWETPCRIDPFMITIEEKQDFILYWKQCAKEAGVVLSKRGQPSWLSFARQEEVVATSEGSLFTQTRIESSGFLLCEIPDGKGDSKALQTVHGIDVAGAGWERFLDAKIPEQFFSGQIRDELAASAAIPSKPFTVGKYTLVCDGATMARVLEGTFGVATQLDRALGYEANAGGTSFIDAPLTMVGHEPVASPLVTVTANRSVPTELATVKWDTEGVVPQPFPIIKNGVLVDFQTTREQAAWLASYYQQHNQPVQSHGCAAIETAHGIPLQMMPNLSLEPSVAAIRMEDLVADVKDGILVENGAVGEIDSQARTGLLEGGLREITNGRLGKRLSGGAVLFASQELWKNVKAIGGASTQMIVGTSQFVALMDPGMAVLMATGKGEPPQATSHSVCGVGATIPNQSVIDPSRKA